GIAAFDAFRIWRATTTPSSTRNSMTGATVGFVGPSAEALGEGVAFVVSFSFCPTPLLRPNRFMVVSLPLFPNVRNGIRDCGCLRMRNRLRPRRSTVDALAALY